MDRAIANALLDAGIQAPPAHRHAEGPWLQRLRAVVTAPSTWRSLGWLALRFPLALISFTIPAAMLGLSVALVIEPIAGGLQDADALPRIAAIVAAAAVAFLDAERGRRVRVRSTAASPGALLGPSRSDELQRLRADTARLGARADLARDLHDSVGHSVTAIVLQASAARRVLETDPAFVAGALEAIEAQGREALDELDRVLAVLRDEPSSPRPSAGLADIDELVARTAAAGLPITLERRGDFATVPAAVGREAYRVLQEALTNVLRHASGAATRCVDRGLRDRARAHGRERARHPDRARARERRPRAARHRRAGQRGRRHARARARRPRRLPFARRVPAAARDPPARRRRRRARAQRSAARCCRPSPTSRSWARRRTASRPSAAPASSIPTSC